MRRTKTNRFESGFTLIETLIAMLYISLLLMGVLLVTLQIIHVYNRGMTLKEVNRIGRSVGDDVQLALNTANNINILPTPNDRDFSTLDPTAVDVAGNRIKIPDYRVDSSTNPRRGVLCTGNVSYFWNFGPSIIEAKANPTQFFMLNSPAGQYPVRLAKVKDIGRDVCIKPSEFGDTLDDPAVRDSIVEVILPGDRSLAVYDFRVVSASTNGVTSQTLYTLNYVLGTAGSDGVDSLIDNSTCRPPDSLNDLAAYCAINRFEVTARNISEQN